MKDKVLIIDTHNLIWRSNVRFSSVNNAKYKYTVVYNFFRSLRYIIDKFRPQKVFCSLESTNNFRYKLYPAYKANRIIKKASEANIDVSRQRDIIIKLLPHLSVTVAYADRFEADDVIGKLSESLKDEDVTILSSDSDFIQLLQRDLNVKLYNPQTKEFVEPPAFHYLGWKILRGDKKTDNIPGLVSDAKALRLIESPLLLEEFLSVEENKASFNLNKQLIELSSVPDEELILTEGSNNFDLLEKEFLKMEFKTLLVDKYWSSFKETFSLL